MLAATGLVDELPEIDGLAEHWGDDVIHCPFCHGFEPMRAAIDTHQHRGPFDPDAYLRVEDFAAAPADAPTDTTSCPSVL